VLAFVRTLRSAERASHRQSTRAHVSESRPYQGGFLTGPSI